MTRLSAPEYLRHLRRETARLRAVLADADPAARVPACPDWDADDLLWHHADVLWFWSEVLRRRPGAPDDSLEQARPVRPTTHRDLLAAYDASAAGLVAEMQDLDGTEPAWSWSGEQTTGFTFRRQAHEVLIHRLDAEQTVGEVTPLDAGLAADGVAELVEVMYGGDLPPWAVRTPGRHVVRIDLHDTGDHLWVRLDSFAGTDPATGTEHAGPTLQRLATEPGTPADAVVRGTAADVDAWMWDRADDAAIESPGDPDALAGLRAVLAEPLD